MNSYCVSYKSGEIIEARAQDLMTDFLPLSFMASTLFSNFTLIYGPFFNERLILIQKFPYYYFFLLSIMYLLDCFLGARVLRPLAYKHLRDLG